LASIFFSLLSLSPVVPPYCQSVPKLCDPGDLSACTTHLFLSLTHTYTHSLSHGFPNLNISNKVAKVTTYVKSDVVGHASFSYLLCCNFLFDLQLTLHVSFLSGQPPDPHLPQNSVFFSLFILYTWMLAPETRNLRWVFVLLFSSLKSLRSAHLQRPLELHLNVRATHKKYLHLNFCLSICMYVCPHFFHVNKL
jgi:hypothetical protein